MSGSLPPPLPNTIALVGCDGTGKSTLVHDLVARLGAERPTVRRYMGLVSGESGDKIKALPVIGPALERYLAAKARRAQDMDQKIPGTFTALVMYGFSIWRNFQLGRLERLARGGTLVIADRFPQAEVPGFNYDGPGLFAGRTRSALAQRLARREQAMYDRMARTRPTLVIRLMIDAETAHGRKPDHPIAELRDKIAIMPRIGYNGAAVVEIDTRRPYPEVLQAALDAVRGAIAR